MHRKISELALRQAAPARDRDRGGRASRACCCSTSRWPACRPANRAEILDTLAGAARRRDRAADRARHGPRVPLRDAHLRAGQRRAARRRHRRTRSRATRGCRAVVPGRGDAVPDLLRVADLRAGYGEAIVIDGVDFALGEGRSLALLGRNGIGKTTLLATLVGVTRYRGGTIELGGRDDHAPAPRPARRRRPRLGAAGAQHLQVAHRRREPHGRRAAGRRGRRRASTSCSRGWPSASANLGTQLSGGEQQMLAIGRALVLNPRLLLLDEPLEGLAPLIVVELLRVLERDRARRGHVGDHRRADRRAYSPSPTAHGARARRDRARRRPARLCCATPRRSTATSPSAAATPHTDKQIAWLCQR